MLQTTVERPMAPPVFHREPRLPDDAPAAPQRRDASPLESTVQVWDGTELFYRAWLPEQPSGRSLFLFHRGHEHSGRLADVVAGLDVDDDVSIFAWDARGHGRSPGRRGYAPSFGHLVHDMDSFAREVARRHGVDLRDAVVVGHSVGAVAAAAWVHDYAPPIRGLVLATPAFRVKLYVPLALPALRVLRRLQEPFGRSAFIKSYVKPNMLTHDAEQAQRYAADPLITRDIAVDVLVSMFDTASRLLDDAATIRVPTQVLAGGSDWVVHLSAERKFFERLGSSVKEMRVFDGMYHDILHERGRDEVLEDMSRFIRRCYDEKRRRPLLDADRQGPTHDEHTALRKPLPAFSPRALSFKTQALALKTAGRLSHGIRLGWETGFDSGESLDHVYDNKARGALGVGRLIDRVYLDSVGWRGIRQRKVHLEKALGRILDLHQCNTARGEGPCRLLDVATGCGRYVLDVVRRRPEIQVEALLRDWSPRNVEAGRRLAADLSGITFEVGDAFDREGLEAIDPPPHVAIVSGLYELFPDNEPVLESLRGLATLLRRTGGYLIYTGQPWHPQLEMIARVLSNRDGRPWVMRRRSQEELDDLVREAGFEKVEMEVDDDGIFTVSVARIRS